MKIGILTQPLHRNYGGILQAFALQSVLEQMGHQVLFVDRQRSTETPLFIKILSMGKRLVIRILLGKSIAIRVWLTNKELTIISQHTNRFIKDNIRMTDKIDSFVKFSLLKKYVFEAYIVGSDQVWRPIYSPCITNYFLDFLDKEDKVKRIAYAASFGMDNWEFSSKQTMRCASLVKRFDAISVREDSALKLCKKYLGVDAVHVLDPTMLLTKEDYIKLVEKVNIPKNKGTLLTYVLDKSSDNKEIMQKVANDLDLIPFSVMPKHTFEEAGKKHFDDCIFLPVTEWIRGFMNADYVVTDSFHGTAFSIIFNKPFLSIGNAERGMARFTSLLKMFGLEERLVMSSDELTAEKIHSSIDFSGVNKILENEQQKAFKFLDEALTNSISED